MSSNYPPPPGPDHQHYNPVYPATAGAQQLLDQQDHVNFANHLGHPAPYPKVETDPQYPKDDGEPIDPNGANAIEQRIEQLQQHHPLQHLPQLAQLQHSQQQQPQQQQQQQQPQQQELQQQPDLHQLYQDPKDQQQLQQSQSASQSQDNTPNKVNRLRKACDSCSIRKVKCDESGPPCRACSSLDIPCTFERPSRRRGPPNRHAEAVKRRRLESPHGNGPSVPSSPTHAAEALAALSSHATVPNNNALSAESILPVDTIDLLINDYFTYIHPLCPFPHEPSFREAWRRREDYNNRPFLALLASMIAALVASFPRKPRLHLKAQRKENIFPNHMALVDKCQKVCAAARGPGYLESDTLSVHDAATSYLLGLAGTYTFRWRQGRLYLGECLTILKALGLHRASDNTFNPLGGVPAVYGSGGPNHEGSEDEVIDNITLQMGRRIFWTLFVSSKAMAQLGANFSELFIPPANRYHPHPPLPAEVDDFCIFPTHIDPQPQGLMPIVAGFNANVRVFLADEPLTSAELARDVDGLFDWEKHRGALRESLHRVKAAMNSLPSELTLGFSGGPFGNDEESNQNDIFAPLQINLSSRDPALMTANDIDASPEQRRNMQYEIQKANIYSSGLCARSHVVEKYFSGSEAYTERQALQQEGDPSADLISSRLQSMLPSASGHGDPDSIEQEMTEERENIIKDLLVVLSSIDRVNMEPNGDSFTQKIRFIASTLVDVPSTRKGSVAQQSEQYLKAFLDILVKLERTSPSHGDPNNPADEEAELRHWADLRECQLRFAQQGGILGLS